MSAKDTIETTVQALDADTPLNATLAGGTLHDTTLDGSRMTAGNSLEGVQGAAAGLRHDLRDKVLVGRHEDCDLRIPDQTVSRKHMLVERKGKAYVAKALNEQNPILHNGRPTLSVPLADGDLLTLGDSVLRVRLSAPAKKPRRSAQAGTAAPNRVRIALYLLLLVCGVGLLFLALRSGQEPQSPEQAVLQKEKDKQEQIQSAALKREISVLLANGIRYFENGDLPQAKGRFQGVLELDPDNTEAKEFLDRIAAQEQEQQAREVQARQSARELQERLSPLLTKANTALATRNYAEAEALLLEAQALAPEHAEVQTLLEQARSGLEETRRQAEADAAHQQRRQTKVERSLAKALESAQAGQLYRALKEFEYVLTLEQSGPTADTARQRIPELQTRLKALTATDFDAGTKLLEEKKVVEALAAWERVLQVYPEHEGARGGIDRLKPALATKGRELYQEGLVLEDLGKLPQARDKWTEAVETLAVLPGDEYLDKARRKLAQYPAPPPEEEQKPAPRRSAPKRRP